MGAAHLFQIIWKGFNLTPFLVCVIAEATACAHICVLKVGICSGKRATTSALTSTHVQTIPTKGGHFYRPRTPLHTGGMIVHMCTAADTIESRSC